MFCFTAAKQALKEIADATSGRETLLAVGVPLLYCGKLFQLGSGNLRRRNFWESFRKPYLPNYAEFS